MIKLRLKRLGAKQQAFYRIVVADSRTQRNGKYIELLGTYNPKNGEVKINKKLVLKWLLQGAKPTGTVRDLFKHEGIMTEFTNLKTKGSLKVLSHSGTRFGKEVDITKGYTKPGTKVSTLVKEEQEVMATAADEAITEDPLENASETSVI